MIGKRISHYKILEKIGSGGMGDVYKGEDTKLKRTVALKFLPLELTRDEGAKQRFLHEARAASALDHPNIGAIYEIDESDGHFFIAMAYYEGKTLKDKIESRDAVLTIDEAVDIASQIAQGLAKAHSKDIVHRDIKPANVLVTEDRQVKVIDFGLAKLKGRTVLTKTGTTIGTVAYMSPEQTQGAAVNHRTDIWALGVMLYEMLAGEQPFKGDYEQAVMYSIMNEEPEFITKVRGDVPVQIERILEKALDKNPEKRFETMEEMREELQNAVEELKEGRRKKPSSFRLGRKQRKYVYRVFAVVLIAIVLGISLWRSQVAKATPVSIILLPLESITNDAEQEWFTNGMTDALITDLAKVSGLRVISRSSAMRYKGTNKTPAEIAAELGVEYLIEGSVVNMGGRVKVSARLINAPRDEYLWAEDYEREFSNILRLQGEIAQTIAGQIQVKLTPQEQTRLASAPRVNPDTYEAYLKGMFYLNKFTPEGIERGMASLREALEKDPTEPLAYAGLALGYSLLASHSPAPPPDAFARAKAAALKALELDETLAEAHGALAEIRLYKDWDWAGAEQAFQRALEYNPSLAPAHAHYAWYLNLFGRHEKALEEMKRAQQVDPLTPLWHAWQGSLHYWTAGEYDKAIEEARKALELDPDFHWALMILGNGYAGKGMYEEAIDAQQKAISANPGFGLARAYLARTYVLAGQVSKARQIAAELEEQNQPMNNFGLTIVYAALGEKDTAFKWMEAAYEHRHPFTPWFNAVFFEPLHDDPRYQELLQRMGLPANETFSKK